MGAVVRDLDEYYELDPAVTTGKGAYDVHPLGFTSFQDRVVRLQAIQHPCGQHRGRSLARDTRRATEAGNRHAEGHPRQDEVRPALGPA